MACTTLPYEAEDVMDEDTVPATPGELAMMFRDPESVRKDGATVSPAPQSVHTERGTNVCPDACHKRLNELLGAYDSPLV